MFTATLTATQTATCYHVPLAIIVAREIVATHIPTHWVLPARR